MSAPEASRAPGAPPLLVDPRWRLQVAAEADLPAIVAIYNSTVPSRMVTADTEPVSVDSRRAWFDAHRGARRPLWVVRAADAPDGAPDGAPIAGWIGFSDFYGRPAYHRTAEVSIYLDESCRGRGLGATLLRAAIDHAPAIGVRTLLGFVFGHNAPSLALFRRFGFGDWGVYPRVAELDGIERDLIVLGRRLED